MGYSQYYSVSINNRRIRDSWYRLRKRYETCVCVCVCERDVSSTVYRSNGRRLHDDVIDDSPGDEKVREEDEREDDHSRRNLHEAGFLQPDVRHLQHRERDAVEHL